MTHNSRINCFYLKWVTSVIKPTSFWRNNQKNPLFFKFWLFFSTNTCTFSYSIEPVFHLRVLWIVIVRVLSLNTVRRYFIMRYVQISPAGHWEGLEKGPSYYQRWVHLWRQPQWLQPLRPKYYLRRPRTSTISNTNRFRQSFLPSMSISLVFF